MVIFFWRGISINLYEYYFVEVQAMNNQVNFYKDIAIGVLYVGGVVGLMSGELIVSSAMIGAATVMSHITVVKSA
jgi:hypothetical protein